MFLRTSYVGDLPLPSHHRKKRSGTRRLCELPDLPPLDPLRAQEHSAKQGWTPERYIEIGAAWVVRSHHIEYFRPAFAGEEVVIDTWVSNFGKTRSLRKYMIRRPADDSVLVTAETNWALVDIAKRRPRRIPQEIIDAFTLVSEADEPNPRTAETANAK